MTTVAVLLIVIPIALGLQYAMLRSLIGWLSTLRSRYALAMALGLMSSVFLSIMAATFAGGPDWVFFVPAAPLLGLVTVFCVRGALTVARAQPNDA